MPISKELKESAYPFLHSIDDFKYAAAKWLGKRDSRFESEPKERASKVALADEAVDLFGA